MFNDPFANQGAGGQTPNQDMAWDFGEMPDEPVIPEGQYVAKVSNIEPGETKNGDQKLVWDFTILAPQEQAGEVLSLHIAITEKAIWKLQQVLVGIGVNPPGGKSLRFTRADALNRMCFITVKHQDFQGRMTANIDQVIVYTEPGKKHVGGMGGMQPPAPAAAPQPAAPSPKPAPTQTATSGASTSTTRPPRPRRGQQPQPPPPPEPEEPEYDDEEYQDDEFGSGEAGTVEE